MAPPCPSARSRAAPLRNRCLGGRCKAASPHWSGARGLLPRVPVARRAIGRLGRHPGGLRQCRTPPGPRPGRRLPDGVRNRRVDSEGRHLHARLRDIDDPFEQTFFAMVQLPYLQPFEDVNKRLSRVAANIPLIRANLAPLSFSQVPRSLYIQASSAYTNSTASNCSATSSYMPIAGRPQDTLPSPSPWILKVDCASSTDKRSATSFARS